MDGENSFERRALGILGPRWKSNKSLEILTSRGLVGNLFAPGMSEVAHLRLAPALVSACRYARSLTTPVLLLPSVFNHQVNPVYTEKQDWRRSVLDTSGSSQHRQCTLLTNQIFHPETLVLVRETSLLPLFSLIYILPTDVFLPINKIFLLSFFLVYAVHEDSLIA